MKIRHVNWYPDDWLSGTYELSLDERGAYVTIVSMIYARGGNHADIGLAAAI